MPLAGKQSPLDEFLASLATKQPPVTRVPGVAVFLSREKATTPLAMRADVEHTHTLHEKVVIRKHAVRNALIPTTTVIGLSYGGLLGGAVLTETIFNWPGVGRLAVTALQGKDYTVVQFIVLLSAISFSVANLIVDIVYARLDPRISYDGQG